MPIKDDPYYKNMAAYTDQYDLTKTQRLNANVNVSKLREDIRAKSDEIERFTMERTSLDNLLEIDENLTVPKLIIEKLKSLHQYQLNGVKSSAERKEKKRLLSELEQYEQEQTSVSLSISPNHGDLSSQASQDNVRDHNDGEGFSFYTQYKKYNDDIVTLTREKAELVTRLGYFELSACQAKNYLESLNALEKSISGGSDYYITGMKISAKNKYNKSGIGVRTAWNHWRDVKQLNKTKEIHEETRVNITLLIEAMRGHLDLGNKTREACENERFIIHTLTRAYNHIDLLLRDHKCCSFLMTSKPDEDLSKIDLGGFNSGYIRVKYIETNTNEQIDKLIYVNKRTKTWENVPPKEYDLNKISTNMPQRLTITQLTDIQILVNHTRHEMKEETIQKDLVWDLHEVHRRCATLQSSGNAHLRYIGYTFAVITAIIVIIAAVTVGMYLGGGAAAAMVTAGLAALHLSSALASVVAATGCGLAIVAPIFLAGTGVVTSTATGLVGFGFWSVGADKNAVSRTARIAATNFLSLIPEISDEQEPKLVSSMSS